VSDQQPRGPWIALAEASEYAAQVDGANDTQQNNTKQQTVMAKIGPHQPRISRPPAVLDLSAAIGQEID
jgi:hypothetical protein